MKSEFDLYPLWQSFCRSRRKSSCGRLQGIDAGDLNCSEGPDFKNALFILDGTRYCGDVEIHLRAKDWTSHGHNHDNRYDHVMLHLVWSPPASDEQNIKTSVGREVPSISMRNFPPLFIPSNQIARCRSSTDNSGRFAEKIRTVIQQRLIGLGRQMHKLTGEKKCDQVFYDGILRVLGSSQNIQNFEWIAQKLNWETIIFLKHKFFLTEKQWYAVFLNMAGLMSSRKEFVPFRAETRRIAHLVPTAQLSRPMWKLAGQRPSHNPLRRLAGLAVFVKNFPGSSAYAVFRDLFYARYPYKIFRNNIRSLFQPDMSTELKTVFNSTRFQHFWGDDLMSEIIGNVAIPFFYYMAKKNGSIGFKNYLESIYYLLPLHNQYSCIVNFLKWPEIQGISVNKFYLHQALLHVRHNFCLNGLCQTCPLNRIAESR